MVNSRLSYWDDLYLYVVHGFGSNYELLLLVVVGDAESGREECSITDSWSSPKHLPDVREGRSSFSDSGCVVREYSDWIAIVVELTTIVPILRPTMLTVLPQCFLH